MADIPHTPLSEFFSLFAPTHVLGTTYTISLAFFEALVFPTIRRKSLRRCLLLSDRVGFQRAIVEATALRAVSREYMVACAPVTGSFHPKVWLMVGEEQVALLVGSGNLTQSGFMENVELFDSVVIRKDGPHRAVIDDLVVFLSGLRGLWSEADCQSLLSVQALRDMEQILIEFARDMPEDAEPSLRFLTSFHGPFTEHFAGYFDKAGTVHIAAPYFGGSTAALISLKDRLLPAKVRVFPAVHSDATVDVPLDELSELPGISVLPLNFAETKRGLCHLKLYGFDSPRGQWVFTTSANCTTAALEGGNIEAGLMRRARKSWLKEYFTARSGAALPTSVRTKAYQDERRVVLLWATDRTGAIEVLTTKQGGIALPLRDIVLTLHIGGETSSHEVPALFQNRLLERIPWEWFPQGTDRTKVTPFLTLQAVSSDGVEVEGAAFIDQPLLLTSDPIHRSAWRAAVALLDGEGGLPDAADLASIFSLVHDVFDAEVVQAPDASGETEAVGGHRPERRDKVAVWPPEPDDTVRSHLPGVGSTFSLRWFQKILAELLHSPRVDHAGPHTSSSDDEDEDGAQPVPPRIKKAAQRAWDQAMASFEQLEDRFGEHDFTSAAAPKIWPVAVAILLVTLATRRRSVERGGEGLKVPSSETLLVRFVLAVFRDRRRSWTLLMDGDYEDMPTDPSVAETLHADFHEDPAPDLADILILLFASLHVRTLHFRGHFPLDEWLVFRDIVPDAPASAWQRIEELRPVAQRFFVEEGVSWESIAIAVDALQRIGWESHPGLQELRAILAKAKGVHAADTPEFPARLKELWHQTDQRRNRGKQWLYAVNRFAWACSAPDCIANGTLDPHKKVLWSMRPTICHSCGSVLVPERLAAHSEALHERPS
jgi:hypothetical protein